MRKPFLVLMAGSALLLGGPSCTTMYDAQGRPQQVMTPEGVAVTAVAAGVVGYALANNRSRDRGRSSGYGHRHYCH